MNNKKRQLAAIMFTDIMGYTALMHQNEKKAATIRERHRAVFQAEHESYKGEILQYYGDGTLSIFQSAVEAVECAITMQQAFQEGEKVPLRIGIHLGDIVIHGNDVYGDGVNLASRIESLGVPGSVLISDKLNFATKNHASISTQSVGYFEFKNIKDPVEVFAVTNAGIRVPQRKELKGKLKEKKKSIAVLPFVNMSTDRENEYFSDGISEEILNALVKVEELQVTARTSSFSFKGKDMDVREIGRQLNVAHILEGSVRKAGNRVRITAQLVSSIDGYHFFSESYDRTLEDIFVVQDEIAQKITNRLRTHLGENQSDEKFVEAPTSNMEAYDIYLKGLYHWSQFGDEAFAKAIPYFEKAIAIQNDFSLPHAKLGFGYLMLAFSGRMTWSKASNKAMFHVNRTIELQTESPEVYYTLACFNFFVKWDWEAVIEVVNRGLKKFPNAAILYHVRGIIPLNKGLRSVEFIKKAVELDPLSIQMNVFLGVITYFKQQYQIAIPAFNRVLEIVPNHRVAIEFLGWNAVREKQYEDALVLFERLQPAIGFLLHKSTCLGWAYYKMGMKDKAYQCNQEILALTEETDQNAAFNFDLAVLYTCFEDFDNAFYYLEKAITHKAKNIMLLSSLDMFFATLRADIRYAKMEALIGEFPTFDS